VLAQEYAMPPFRASEWIVPPIVVPLFLLLLVGAAVLFRG
jgi:hypothetical protein